MQPDTGGSKWTISIRPSNTSRQNFAVFGEKWESALIVATTIQNEVAQVMAGRLLIVLL